MWFFVDIRESIFSDLVVVDFKKRRKANEKDLKIKFTVQFMRICYQRFAVCFSFFLFHIIHAVGGLRQNQHHTLSTHLE